MQVLVFECGQGGTDWENYVAGNLTYSKSGFVVAMNALFFYSVNQNSILV